MIDYTRFQHELLDLMACYEQGFKGVIRDLGLRWGYSHRSGRGVMTTTCWWHETNPLFKVMFECERPFRSLDEGRLILKEYANEVTRLVRQQIDWMAEDEVWLTRYRFKLSPPDQHTECWSWRLGLGGETLVVTQTMTSTSGGLPCIHIDVFDDSGRTVHLTYYMYRQCRNALSIMIRFRKASRGSCDWARLLTMLPCRLIDAVITEADHE